MIIELGLRLSCNVSRRQCACFPFSLLGQVARAKSPLNERVIQGGDHTRCAVDVSEIGHQTGHDMII